MTLQSVLIRLSLLFIFLVHRIHTEWPDSNRTVTEFFDLSRVKGMSDAELQRNYHSIVLTMRRMGRSVLKYFRSDMVKMILDGYQEEDDRAALERWQEQCDFLLDHEDVEHFKTYILSEDDRLVDGTGYRTAGVDMGLG